MYKSDFFTTTHELFKIPVVDDAEDLDSANEILSKIRFGDERHTLLANTSLIIWDEFMSNHSHCLNAAAKATNNFRGKVVVCMGDTRQIPPVVVRGSVAEVSTRMLCDKSFPYLTFSRIEGHRGIKFEFTVFQAERSKVSIHDTASHQRPQSGRSRCFECGATCSPRKANEVPSSVAVSR